VGQHGPDVGHGFQLGGGDGVYGQRLLRGDLLYLDLAGLAADGGDRPHASQERSENNFLGDDAGAVLALHATGAHLIADNDLSDAARDGIAEFHRVWGITPNFGALRDRNDCLMGALRRANFQRNLAALLRYGDAGDASLFPIELLRLVARGDVARGDQYDAARFPHAIGDGHHDAIARENAGHRGWSRVAQAAFTGRALHHLARAAEGREERGAG